MGFFGLFGGFNPSKCKTAPEALHRSHQAAQEQEGPRGETALRKEIADLLGADKTESARVRIEGVMREGGQPGGVRHSRPLLRAPRGQIETHRAGEGPSGRPEGGGRDMHLRREAHGRAPGTGPDQVPVRRQVRAGVRAGVRGRRHRRRVRRERTAIQKLSVAPPTNEEKLAKLRAIAEEHRVPFDEEEATKSLAQATKIPAQVHARPTGATAAARAPASRGTRTCSRRRRRRLRLPGRRRRRRRRRRRSRWLTAEKHRAAGGSLRARFRDHHQQRAAPPRVPRELAVR